MYICDDTTSERGILRNRLFMQLPDFSDTEFSRAFVYGDKTIVPVTTDNGEGMGIF